MSTIAPTRDSSPVEGSAKAGPRGGSSSWWLYLLLILGVVLLVGPFIWMVLGSLKTTGELRQVPPTLLPQNATLENYAQLWERLLSLIHI